MGLFSSRWSGSRPQPNARPPHTEQVAPIPIAPIDFSRRYDVCYSDIDHDRLYENVCFVGIRTFDRITEFSPGLIHSYFEIETVDGIRFLIPTLGIKTICEHGVQPIFKVLRRRRN